jgi:predicted DNA-binding protein YlxM (UPF0122 family)
MGSEYLPHHIYFPIQADYQRKTFNFSEAKMDCGISEREIARSCQVSRSTVADYLRRAAAAKLTWTEASALAESQLEERLFPSEHIPSTVKRPPPDCEHIYHELRTYRKFNLTLSQLWLEYKEKHPGGYQYTQFCEHYWRWRKKLDYGMVRSLEARLADPKHGTLSHDEFVGLLVQDEKLYRDNLRLHRLLKKAKLRQ